MAQIRLGIGQVNIVDYLIVVARKTTTPGIVEAQEVYAPAHPAIRNVVVPAVGDIDPVIYYLDVRESADGISLGLLLSQFQYDLKNKIVISETRFYFVGGGRDIDPAPDQNILSDPYLDGKTISSIFIDGYGRPLVPPEFELKEYDPYVGGGIQLVGEKVFSVESVVVVVISYLGQQVQGGNGGSPFSNGVETITASTILDSDYRNKRLKCESNASSRLVVTLEDVTAVPEGTFYYFMCNGGNQFQTRILPAAGQTILYNNDQYAEMSYCRGEYIRIEKTGAIWEGVMVHSGILQVGERFSGTWIDHPNTKPEDATLYDGDDWPRPWWWIKNRLPVTHYIIDDAVINGGYVHPAGKEGLFVIHSSLKKFRLPNWQNLSERGLKSFTNYNTDDQRVYDYPGGGQNPSVGDHSHDGIEADTGAHGASSNPLNGIFKLLVNIVSSGAGHGTVSGGKTGGVVAEPGQTKEQRVKNGGVIYLRRF